MAVAPLTLSKLTAMFIKSLIALLAAAPASLRPGVLSLPFRAPKKPSKTYGAMPVDHLEVGMWNLEVGLRNQERGKKRL
jgi:hypothetical protein